MTTLNIESPINNLSLEAIRSAVERSRSPLILTDNGSKDNPIIYANAAFLELTGYDYTDIIGHNCRFLQGKDTDQTTVDSIREAVKSGGSIRANIQNYKKDGTPFWNDLIVSPIKDDNGNIAYFMGMQLDITDRIENQELLMKKKVELETSNAELEQFTYATSHDLQEPLRMISSYLQLLDKRYGHTFDEKAATYMNFASEGAARMQDLITDLLLLSRVTSSSDVFTLVDVRDVVDRALRNLKVTIDEVKPIVTISKLPKQLADPVQLTQLFQNLISNAIKYHTPGTTPEITISAEIEQDEIVYSVSDNGIGIEERYFDRIFSVFQRLHTRNEYEGTGVGLAICSRIVDRHHGKLWVESVFGKGSTFRFSIPIKESEAL